MRRGKKWEAIKELYKREYIIITNSDKGGTVGIAGGKDYIKEAELKLNNNDNCYILPQDPVLGKNEFAN